MAGEQTERKRRQWWRIEGERILLNAEATASRFRVTTRTLLDWVERGCPKEEGPGAWYDPFAVMRWRMDSDSSAEARKTEADADYRRYKAEKERINLEILQGEYFRRDQVESEWSSRILELKAGLAALPREATENIADLALRRQIEQVIRDAIYEMLTKYAREGVYTPQTSGTKKSPAKRGAKDSKTRNN